MQNNLLGTSPEGAAKEEFIKGQRCESRLINYVGLAELCGQVVPLQSMQELTLMVTVTFARSQAAWAPQTIRGPRWSLEFET